MAGRKHHLQQAGITGLELNKIADPFERDFAFRSMQATPYCQHCGEVVVSSEQDEAGFKVDYEWEIKHRSHYKCHQKWQVEEEEKILKAQMQAEQARKKAAAEFDWDRYMQEQLNKRSE